MDLYMDEKWKLSKKGSRNASSRREQSTTTTGGGGAYLKRSSSMPESVKGHRNRPGSGPSSANPRNFTSRCANLVKEQRAKFYIMRRCVTMLICWRDYS